MNSRVRVGDSILDLVFEDSEFYLYSEGLGLTWG